MRNKKLKIYLADLIHDHHIYNYSVPLNVGYITAMLNARLGKSVDSKITLNDQLDQDLTRLQSRLSLDKG